MAWTRIDDGFYDNIKIKRAGPEAAHLYVAGLIYCNKKLTDGFIECVVIPAIAGNAFCKNPKKAISKLIENGLWEEAENGYQVHDYLAFNKSKKQIEELNQKRAEIGASGGRKSKQIGEQLGNQIGEQLAPPNIPNIPNHYLRNEKDSTTTATREARAQGGIAEISKTYESEIGFLTGSIRDELVLMVGEYPAEWISEAIKEAAKVNKRSLKYTQGILKRWKVEGFKSDTRIREKGGNGYRRENIRTKPDMGGYKVDRSNEIVVIEDGYEPEGGGK